MFPLLTSIRGPDVQPRSRGPGPNELERFPGEPEPPCALVLHGLAFSVMAAIDPTAPYLPTEH